MLERYRSEACAADCNARLLSFPDEPPTRKALIMLGWVLTFLVMALITALLVFSGIVGAFAEGAQALFFVFLALSVLILCAWGFRRPMG